MTIKLNLWQRTKYVIALALNFTLMMVLTYLIVRVFAVIQLISMERQPIIVIHLNVINSHATNLKSND